LGALVAAGQQEVDDHSASGVVDPLAWAEINAHFRDPVPYRFAIPKVAQGGRVDAGGDSGFAFQIFELKQPTVKFRSPLDQVILQMYPNEYSTQGGNGDIGSSLWAASAVLAVPLI